ncbi:hypothetical protein EAX62_14125 [Tessaracoccus antarcticus]|uniref:LPXTG cell wall anchor domain-containing protein n=2 Tax=Tessaracoccus antarcticus TaxID=2479848 RepID=A0A3M0G7H8_9ACTN|nr:hypothetical protein EAX62_14125 [Tessaracoccus antarcticus]
MHPASRSGAWSALLARMGLAILLALMLVPAVAHADDLAEPPPSSPGANAVGSCLLANQVWLLVVDVDDEILANQCVGTPASGEEALARGGIQIRFSGGRLICSMSGHPEQCPATFTGSYWNYNFGAAGTSYAFSQEGASSRRPVPGGIEAWCYNAPEEKTCTPPLLRILSKGQQIMVPGADASDYIDPPVTANEPVAVPATTPWALIGTGAVIVVAVLVLLWWRRRSGPSTGQVGGR